MAGFVSAESGPPKSKFDVVIVGSGAGGAVTAETLASAGFEVLVIEEGGHYTKADFKMREDIAFPQLYQEAGARATKDLGITILQGRAVGGSTVVNWTTSFRTPERVLEYWKKEHGVSGFGRGDLDPHWDAIEERLNVRTLPLDESNRNNLLLHQGLTKLGFSAEPTRRNTRGCFKSGYCGMGCPVDAKQSMLITYLPDAVAKGATVLSRARVDRLRIAGDRATAVEVSEIGPDGYGVTGRTFVIEANRVVLSAGAIGTPAILMRSGLGGGMVGRRTFLHPAFGVSSIYEEDVNPFYGAPQSVASHAFAERGDKVGFFLEAAPLHPMIASMASSGFGAAHRSSMRELPRTAAHVAITIDGFHPSEVGGTVELRPSGAPALDYRIPPRIWEAGLEGLKQLTRANLAVGAKRVLSGHEPPIEIRSESDLALLDRAPMEVNRCAVFSAHVMGGAMMGDDPKRAVVRSEDLRLHRLTNVHVVDASVFPTSLGVNPQETIYGIARLMATRLTSAWKPA